ncbi:MULTISPECIES: Na+/H+ antiporter subunit E [unclassified Paracoccus (in: a-proteobacteria)]|uniref:Na+/H+ antiporter subunit E n=1 Tax=unclassified Paracoccus (in: a-proteobacteria) TaxID=2688777 RepID=UPI0012B366BF|nr:MULTISPECIES: Na+/H+ antiporter subunit E [unclassified Paracoccus (in: a-proteobacteria)]UXU75390.1 Na+/H+ antiporter subunit E [Paracoccus sp. SMMA_5]UXU81294.1 Na+/H+ antiporter subunit E [Paracoccus sp. SMMA_5_TC]
MMRRLFPHPWLSLVLTATWLLLVNGWSVGSLIFAAMLGLVVPWLTAPYWPGARGLTRPGKVPAYVALVLWDIVRANFTVARIVLFTPRHALRPAWIVVPLDLTRPEAIVTLASTITLTPGTVSCDMSDDGRALLVHAMHAPDPDAVLHDIKTRYEARLKEIFE